MGKAGLPPPLFELRRDRLYVGYYVRRARGVRVSTQDDDATIDPELTRAAPSARGYELGVTSAITAGPARAGHHNDGPPEGGHYDSSFAPGAIIASRYRLVALLGRGGMRGTNPQMYAAVKGGVLAFSKSLARSVAPRVRVNVLAPGWIQTSFGDGLDDETRRKIAGTTPLERWGTPEDVAGAAVFLASPAAAFLTGQTILVGGGAVM